MAFFRIATEGATSDGRNIERQALEQMAANYDPDKYGARVWLEHMRGIFADGPFPALGDVTALKAEEDDAGKMGLYADIDPTDELKSINQARQKVYTSMEVDPEFAGTGSAYLVGLAVTDSPSSLGTEMLQFSQQHAGKPLDQRKQRPENLFTAAVETEFEFSAPNDNAPAGDKPSLLDNVKALFRKHDKMQSTEFDAFRRDLEATLELFVQRQTAADDALAKRADADAFAQLQSEHTKLRQEFDALYKRLDETPDNGHRSPALGGAGGDNLTDC